MEQQPAHGTPRNDTFVHRVRRADQCRERHERGERDLPEIALGGANQERQREEQQLLLQRLAHEIHDEVAHVRPAALEPQPDPRLHEQPEPAEQCQQRDCAGEPLSAPHHRKADPAADEAHERQQPRVTVVHAHQASDAARPPAANTNRRSRRVPYFVADAWLAHAPALALGLNC